MLNLLFQLPFFVSWVNIFISPIYAQQTPHTRKYFYIGGQYVTDAAGIHYKRNQLYVEQLLPAHGQVKPYPLVLIHGLAQTGTNWLNKPDGKPGWADYFLRNGYELFIIDVPQRGRSPFSVGNVTHVATSAEYIQQYFTAPENYNLYPMASLHTQWPDGLGKGVIGSPAFDAYYASLYPSIPANVPHQTISQAAGIALLDQINRPVILIGHSQVRAIVALEPAGPPFIEPSSRGNIPARAWGVTDIQVTFDPPVVDPNIELVKKTILANSSEVEACTLQADSPPPRQLINLKNIPALVLTTDASWHMMYDWCTVAFLRQAGVNAEHIMLRDLGLKGNGHMFFLENNSDQTAEVVQTWIESN